MKSKTIKAVLRKKFNEFANSIKDEDVRSLVMKNSIITGGSIASMLLKEPVNDYDVYFTNRETVLAVCNYYCDLFNERNDTKTFTIIDGTLPIEDYDFGDYNINSKEERRAWYDCNVSEGRIKIRIESIGVAIEPEEEYNLDYDDIDIVEENSCDSVVEDGGIAPVVDIAMNGDECEENKELYEPFRPIYISANAITLSDNFQLIIRFFGDAQEIHSNYDYEHCKCWWTSKDSHLELPNKSLECLLAKELVYSGSKYPLASIIRSRKFIDRGFTINAGQYLKMCYDLNEYNLRDLKVLEDQLTGIDAFWFAKMIACIDDDELKKDVDNSYLFTLINRFF